MKPVITLLACVMLLAACKNIPGQNAYSSGEVGISRSVQFGTVINAREVDIQAKTSGVGSLAGAAAGVGAGSAVGSGSGNDWAIIGGVLAGAVAGHYAEQALTEHKGWEYTVMLQSGEVKTIVQESNDDDIVFIEGAKVMLQYCDGGDKSRKCSDRLYQRLLSVKKLPPYTKKGKKPRHTDVAAPEF